MSKPCLGYLAAFLLFLTGRSAAIKRMMVDKNYRGTVMGVSAGLLDACVSFARNSGAESVYLGTMSQFKAAQKFYLKHGFREITLEELPSDYTPNPIDS